MPVADTLSLRINGQEYTKVKLRFKMEGGYPGGQVEVVIPDDFLGTFPLTSEFDIELKEEGGGWKKVTLPYLVSMLEAYRT
jgi:hypothetical protein